jgi:hypothetical protein
LINECGNKIKKIIKDKNKGRINTEGQINEENSQGLTVIQESINLP